MAGIFDVINNPNNTESSITVSPAFVGGIFMMSIAGIRTNGQLRTLLETELDRTLVQAEIDDFTDLVTFIAAGTGEEGKVARLTRVVAVCRLWETGQGGISESEARTMMGAFS